MIMMRNAHSDFEAFLIAEAMEKSGVEVISITFDYVSTSKRPSFLVFARAATAENIKKADEAISAELTKAGF